MSGIRLAWVVCKNDLLLNLANISSTIMAILIPINFLILFSLFALSGALAPVTVQLNDQGASGRAMVHALDTSLTFRKTMVQTDAEAQRAIQRGSSVANIRIPADFSAKLSAGRETELAVTINNLNADFANDIRRGLPLGILNFYKQNQPQKLPFTWREIDEYPHDVSFIGFLAVSIQTVALLLGGVLLTGRNAAGEWERGTIKELKLAPVPAWSIILGKTASGFVNGLCSALIVLAALLLIGIHPQNWLLFIAVMLLVLFVFSSVGLMVGVLVRSQFIIYPLVMGIALPLFFVSGAFGPISWSTRAAAWIARVFPVVYANAEFQQAIHGFWTMDTGTGVAWIILIVWTIGSLSLSSWVYHRTASVR